MSKTIAEFFGTAVTGQRNFNKAVPLVNPDPSLLYGVELEIEGCVGYEEWRCTGISAKNDNSLRNNGMEFVTAPMTYSNLAFCLKNFFDKSKVGPANYSERCSTHVHANCNDMTMPQVATVLLLYTTFEKVLYAFVGADRDKNIFCVPWNETSISLNYIASFAAEDWSRAGKWQKYTGLNTLPLQRYGTLEFRQMHGTHDLNKILTWCRIIGRMFHWAKNKDFNETREKIISLNTNSHYGAFFEEVFKDEAQALYAPQFEELLEEGVLNVKYASLQMSGVKPQPANPHSLYELMRADLDARRQRAAEEQIEAAQQALRLRPANAQPAHVGLPNANWVIRDEYVPQRHPDGERVIIENEAPNPIEDFNQFFRARDVRVQPEEQGIPQDINPIPF